MYDKIHYKKKKKKTGSDAVNEFGAHYVENLTMSRETAS